MPALVENRKLTQFVEHQIDLIISAAVQGYAELGVGAVVVQVFDRACFDRPGRPDRMHLMYVPPATIRALPLTEESRFHILRKVAAYDPARELVVSLIYPGGDLSMRIMTPDGSPLSDAPVPAPIGRA